MSVARAAEDDVSTLHDWSGREQLRRSVSRMHTFKAQSHRGNKLMKLHDYAKLTLGAGNVLDAVRLPPGEDLNEWFAMHIVDFYNEITLLYAIVADLDTEEKFPVMGAGKHKCV
jgi:MOB kinase activator 1